MNKKIAIVTGAAKGIGKSIVERLVIDGFSVIAVDIDEVGGKKIQSANVEFIKADISDEQEVVSLFSKIKKVDVLVNNAGIIRDNMIWNMPSADFDLVMNINLKGVWLMCREAAKMMKEQKDNEDKKQ